MSDAGGASWAASFSPPAKTAGLDALMLCDPRILCPIGPIRSYQVLSGPGPGQNLRHSGVIKGTLVRVLTLLLLCGLSVLIHTLGILIITPPSVK